MQVETDQSKVQGVPFVLDVQDQGYCSLAYSNLDIYIIHSLMRNFIFKNRYIIPYYLLFILFYF